ncbi:MAG: tetratricopeptide repeat protein [bacterium]|nr:tetratricopeptide repeat protein [bacterium]
MKKWSVFLILLLLLTSFIRITPLLAIGAIGHLKKGNEYLKEKKYSLAINEYKTSLALNPYYTEAFHQLALAYFRENNLEKAEENFKKAIKLNDNYFDAHNNLGLVYEEQNKLEEALKEYNKAKEIEPGNYRVYYNLGGLCHKKKDLKNAIINYKKILKIYPQHAWTCINLGSLFLIPGDFYDPDKAMAYYQKALLYGASNPWIDINIASIYYNQGLIYKAIEEYEKAIKKSPQNIYALSALAGTYVEQNNYSSALFLYEKIVKIKPENFIAWYNLGLIYEINKNYDKALSSYKKALQINPYDELALYRLENIILKKEDISSPLRKKYANWHLDFGHYYFKERQIVLTNHEYKRSIELYPQDPKSRFSYSNLLKFRNYVQKEIEEIEKIIELDPINIKVKDRLEKLYYLRPKLLSVKEKIDLATIPPSGVTILIINFKPKKILHQHIHQYVTYLTRTFLGEFPQLKIIEKDEVANVLKKQRINKITCIEHIFNAGKSLNAQMALWGEIHEEEDEIKVLIKLVDIKTLTNTLEVELVCNGNNKFKEIANLIQKYVLKDTPLLGEIIRTKIAKNQVIINLGARHLVKKDHVFDVWEEGRKYLDPTTGRTMRYKEKVIGKIKVVEVDNDISLAVPITFELIKLIKSNKITLLK